MIPKIIHQIWVGDFKLPKREQQLTNEIEEMHPDYEYVFWTSAPKLPDNVQYWYDTFYSMKNYAFCADLLRMWVVKEFGGFYLDVDFRVTKSLDNFLPYDGLFLYHNEHDLTIPNNVFGATKDLDVLNYCIQEIRPNNSWYGPSWFGSVVKSSFGLTYETPHEVTKNKMKEKNIEYFMYGVFEDVYARHLSLYSWSPEVWNRLNNQEQL
jgi:mannosyltransferase OCH1-like enzyme